MGLISKLQLGQGWDPSQLLSYPAEGKDSSETSGRKPQGALDGGKQMRIHGLAGLLGIATAGRKCPSAPESLWVW